MSAGNGAPVSTATQDQWKDINDAFRAQLAKALPLMPAMTPCELLSMAQAIDNGMWNELKAATYDEAVEERRRSLERQAQYGG